MSESQEFKFKIEWPQRAVASDERYQLFKIYAAYPHFVYSVIIKPSERISEADQKRLAISELKVKLIQQIANAEFTQEETK